MDVYVLQSVPTWQVLAQNVQALPTNPTATVVYEQWASNRRHKRLIMA